MNIEANRLPPYQGAFRAYKAVRRVKSATCFILLLKIPADAHRVYGYIGNNDKHKCRASKAVVEAALPCRNDWGRGFVPTKKTVGRSSRTSAFRYHVGQTVKPEGKPFEKSQSVCAPGIHFFMRREDAEAYAGVM